MCKFETRFYCTHAKEISSSKPFLWNLKVEIPALRQTFPRFFWRGLFTLHACVPFDKTADTHDPRAHQSRLCPSAPVLPPSPPQTQLEDGKNKEAEKVHSDTQKCLSLGYIWSVPGDVISLSHFFPAQVYIWTLNGTSKGANSIGV